MRTFKIHNQKPIFKTMKQQHTPGIWRVAKCHPNENFSIYASGPIAYTEKEPDANLIASAPEMLDAIQAIVSDYSALMRSQGASADIGGPSSPFTAGEWVGSRLGANIAKAQCIISKARGEA